MRSSDSTLTVSPVSRRAASTGSSQAFANYGSDSSRSSVRDPVRRTSVAAMESHPQYQPPHPPQHQPQPKHQSPAGKPLSEHASPHGRVPIDTSPSNKQYRDTLRGNDNSLIF